MFRSSHAKLLAISGSVLFFAVAAKVIAMDHGPSRPTPILSGSVLTGRASGAAAEFVASETPASVLSFSSLAPGSGGRLVIAHYFAPFPITIGSGGETNDYYARNYLRADGEHGKFARGGGFLRERPLVSQTGSSSTANLEIEIARAARIGIDAFGVDLLDLNGKSAAVAHGLLSASQAVDPRFRIALEPDMTSLKGVSPDELASFVIQFAKHQAALRTADGKLVVMPFAAERQEPSFWHQFVDILARNGEHVALIPDYVNPTSSAQLADISAAAALWGSRDAGAGSNQGRFAKTVKSQGYPAWVSTAAPQDMRPKSLVVQEAAGSTSFIAALLSGSRQNAAALHLVTWNDYSEGSELSPSSVTRFAYYDLAAYYIAAFKQGRMPAILRDGFIGLHRRQLFRPDDTTRGAPWRVRGAPTQDIVEMTAFLTRPAVLAITTGGQTFRSPVDAGVQRLTAPAAIGGVGMAIERSGKAVVSCRSPWEIEARPGRQDPLYAGFSSLRGCD